VLNKVKINLNKIKNNSSISRNNKIKLGRKIYKIATPKLHPDKRGENATEDFQNLGTKFAEFKESVSRRTA